MPEELLISQCSPTMAGLKTGNLFNCPMNSKQELNESIRRLNKRIVPCGVRILPIKYMGDRALIYMYRPKKLREDLADVFDVHNNENKIVDNKAINNNQLLQFRIEVLNNNYRYLLLLADKNQREFKTILQKGDLSSGESLNDDTDIIECYSACDDIIYTCETSVNSDEYYLCTYDLNGKRLTKERMYALENIEDMKGYMMWDMEVIGNDMIYFDSLSNRRITAEKSENGFKVIDELNNLRLLKDYKCVDKENRRFYYFYENYDDKFYRFDKDTKEIDIIDVSGYKISNCTLDGDRIIFSNDNDKSNLEYYEVVFDE